MKQAIILTTALAITITGFGCSSAPVEQNNAANAEYAAITDFASITDPNVALAEGKRLLDENQTEQAIAALKQAVHLNPDLAEAHFQLGIAYALLEMQKELEGVAVAASEDNTESKNSNSKGERAKTRSEKSFERAVEAYKKWLDANPKDDVGYYNMGRAYSKLMKDEEAKEAFEEAVKLKPEDAEYQTELGSILIKLAEYHQAIPALKKAVELDPSNVRAQDLLEDAQAGRQRLDYVSPKNTNSNSAKSDANSNSNTNTNSVSNSNTAPRRDSNTKSNRQDPPKNPTPNRSTNRSN
jgi:tetratricopeptide (TPR) repeat protein